MVHLSLPLSSQTHSSDTGSDSSKHANVITARLRSGPRVKELLVFSLSAPFVGGCRMLPLEITLGWLLREAGSLATLGNKDGNYISDLSSAFARSV